MSIDHTITFDGHEIATRDWGGDGPPLVVIPGGGRNLADWELAVPTLRSHHRVIGVDPPGHGASSEPPRWDWDLAVGFVEQTIRACDLDDPFVAGHSVGGMIAARYGLKHPDAPGVVNIDGHGSGPPSLPQDLQDERARLMKEAPEPPPDSGDDEWLESILAMMRPSVEALHLSWEDAEPAILRSFVRTPDGRWQRRPSNAFGATVTTMGPDLFDLYRAVECPLLIFNCNGEMRVPGMSQERVARYREALTSDLDALQADCPHVEIATVESGHMVVLERPGTTAELIIEFTSRHRR